MNNIVSGYQCDIRPGKPGYKKFDKNGNPIHFVSQETWKNLREQLGVVEERIKDNSMRDALDSAKNRSPSFRLEYSHSGDLLKKLNDNVGDNIKNEGIM